MNLKPVAFLPILLSFVAVIGLTACGNSGESSPGFNNDIPLEDSNNPPVDDAAETPANPPVNLPEDPTPSISPSAPSAPSNLRGVVYTEYEIEIFWDRAPAEDEVVNYDIRRNSELMDTRDGLSYYNGELEPATLYRYEVVAINRFGERSEPASIDLMTREAKPTVHADNAEELLQFVATVINEDQLRGFAQFTEAATVYSGTNTEQALNNGFEYLSSEFYEDGAQNNYHCVLNGGEFSAYRSYGTQEYIHLFRLNQCQSSFFNNEPASGNASRRWTLRKTATNAGSYTDTYYDAVEISHTDGSVETLNGFFAGGYGSYSRRYWQSYVADFSNPNLPETATQYTASAFAGATTINIETVGHASGVTTEPNAEPWRRTLTADFTAQAPATGNKPIVVKTMERFITYANGSCYDNGVMRIEGNDGSSMQINASNGDVNSFRLSITSANGNTQLRTVAWSNENIFNQLPDNAELAPSTIQSVCTGYLLDDF